ncbi:MAG: YtxH domain-containing protein [Chitinophagales bacterium]|nr:YtxH domain-containing protein [Chitinophagales bacterium]
MKSRNTALAVLAGIAAGAAIGAIAGILLAPDSGENTRKKITDKYGDLKDQLATGVDGIVSKGKDMFRSKADQAVEKGREVADNFKNKAKEAADYGQSKVQTTI